MDVMKDASYFLDAMAFARQHSLTCLLSLCALVGSTNVCLYTVLASASGIDGTGVHLWVHVYDMA